MTRLMCIQCGSEFEATDPGLALCPVCSGQAGTIAGGKPFSEDLYAAIEAQPVMKGSDWQAGQVVLDTYEVIAGLGMGGFGKVYRVHHRAWDIDLAVKRPLKLALASRQSFTAEAEKWVELGLHPNIISCYYVRTIDGFPHTFAELAEGGSLRGWIRSGRLYEGGLAKALERILDCAIQFAWGLAYAHDCGLVHQDVKPDNVLMAADGTAKVADFGLAQARPRAALQSQSPGASDGSVSAAGGTQAYMSPEQSAGKRLTLKTDLWSWAVSVLEMFTGEVTWFSGVAAPSVLDDYLELGTELAGIPNMPEKLAELLRECFQDDPQARPQDMLIIAKRLVDLYQQASGQIYPRKRPEATKLRADSLNNKALSMLDLGKADEAVKAWQDALEIDPHHPEATYNLGLWRWQVGQQTDLALVQQLEAVRRILPDSWMPNYLSGLAHRQRRDGVKAKQAFEAAVRLSPGNPLVEAALKKLANIQPFGCLHKLAGHTQFVEALAITPDGRTIISGGQDKTLRVWDLKSGRLLHLLEGHKAMVTLIAITPDGRKVVSGSPDKTLRVWDLSSGKCLHTLEGHTDSIGAIAITPDGRRVVSGAKDIFSGKDSTLRVWELESGKCLRILEGNKGSITVLAITPDGRRAISNSGTTSGARAIRIWDLVRGGPPRSLEGHTLAVFCLAITPDGRRAVSGSWDKTIRIWDLESEVCLGLLEGHTDSVKALVLTPDGRQVLSGSADETIRIWDLESGRALRSLDGQAFAGDQLWIAPDGRRLVAGGRDETVRVWDLESGRCLHSFEGQSGRFAIPPDGGAVVSISSEWTLDILELPEGPWLAPEWVINRPQAAQDVQAVAGKIQQDLQIAETALKEGRLRQAVEIVQRVLRIPGFERDSAYLDLSQRLGRKVGQAQGLLAAHTIHTLTGHTKNVTTFAVSPDGRTAVSGSWDEPLRVWDLASGACLRSLEGEAGSVTSLVISPDGKKLIAGCEDASLRVWELESGRVLDILQGHSGEVKSLAISPNGRTVVSGSADTTLRVWELEQGECRQILEGHSEWIKTIVISPDGRTVLSGGSVGYEDYDERMRAWDLESGRCLQVMEGHSGGVDTLAVTPDGRKVVSSSGQTIRIWDLENGKCLHTLDGHPGGTVEVIAITPDGQRVVTGSTDASLFVWELASGKCLHRLEGHSGPVNQILITPDGRIAITGGWDDNLRIWNLADGKLLQILRTDSGKLSALGITPDGGQVITGGEQNSLLVWALNWDYAFPEPADWDEGARPYLETFLTLHSPYAGKLPQGRSPTAREVTLALSRQGKATWSEAEFQELMGSLGVAGFGWLREAGVRRKLEEMGDS